MGWLFEVRKAVYFLMRFWSTFLGLLGRLNGHEVLKLAAKIEVARVVQKCVFWVMLAPFWDHFGGCWWKHGSKNRFKQRCPARVKRGAIRRPGGSLTAPLACAVFWTRINNLSKKQQQLLISESISESFSWNQSFLSPFLENYTLLMKSATKKNSHCRSCCLLSLSLFVCWWSLWPKT